MYLDKKSITLNMNSEIKDYEDVQIKVGAKDAPMARFETISVAGADAKAKAQIHKSLIFDVEDGVIGVRLYNCKNLKAGTYKFNVYGNLENGVVLKAPLSVKVVDKAPASCVKLSAKGSIDILNRDTTQIIYTAKMSNMTGNIESVYLAGMAASSFEAEVIDGKIHLKAKEDASLITKYNYVLQMHLILDNGNVVKTKEVKVKVTQSKPKTVLSSKQGTIFAMVENHGIPFSVTAVHKDGSNAEIRSVELVGFEDVFSYENGLITLKDRSKAVSGKTYALKFAVRYQQSADNENAAMVTYKVKVN